MAITGVIVCVKTYGWLIPKDPGLVQKVNTDYWMHPYLPTLVNLERVINRPVPMPGLENPLLYFCQQGNERIPGKCNTMLGDDK